MAINIFSGGSASTSKSKKSGARKKKSNTLLNRDIKQAMVPSNEGSVAVKKGGILGKIGGFAKKVLPIAARFAPGPVGTVAKLAENIFNDPEWWQHVPGESVAMNAPLAAVSIDDDQQTQVSNVTTPTGASGVLKLTYGKLPQYHVRPFMLEIASYPEVYSPGQGVYVLEPRRLFNPDEKMLNQYFMSEIRRVVNAVPLQDAATYREVLANNALAYAIWRQLKSVQVMTRMGKTYLPSFNDPMFPICQVANKATLDAMVSRLEEFLHASVRLPHTLCEYLAWRFGRIYKINPNAKSAIVRYSAVPLTTGMLAWGRIVDNVLTYNTATTARQFAATDIYNAYIDHDLEVEIKDETQYQYDLKEFALRTNLDVGDDGTGPQSYFGSKNPIKIDSDLDNPTVFMSSTVSTRAKPGVITLDILPLFPVHVATAFLLRDSKFSGVGTAFEQWSDGQGNSAYKLNLESPSQPFGPITYPTSTYITAVCLNPRVIGDSVSGSASALNFHKMYPAISGNFLFALMCCKALEYYNAGFFALAADIGGYVTGDITITDTVQGASTLQADVYAFDLTAPADDLGVVDDSIVDNEQVFAFANLASVSRKSSMSYKRAEAVVAKETADTLATMDIAVKG